VEEQSQNANHFLYARVPETSLETDARLLESRNNNFTRSSALSGTKWKQASGQIGGRLGGSSISKRNARKFLKQGPITSEQISFS
jgi:hypothetical protein